MGSRWLGWLLVALVFLVGIGPATAQVLPSTISLSVSAGFDGYFRDGQWMPLFVRVSNNGDDVEGWLVVRPETSGSGITNTYSVPISLASGAQKAASLYITARALTNQIRVDFVDQDGVVITNQPVTLRSIQPQDQLHVVVTQAAAGSVDLTGVRLGGHNAYQANWQVENVPDRAAALDSVNLILFSDVDTGGLSTDQRQALADWVAEGGHLLVTGGANWQATAAGLADLLPLMPQESQTVEDLSELAQLGGEKELAAQTVITTGDLQPNARVLATTPDGVPLLARQTMGAGTVDYLTAAPSAEPLRGWGGMTDLWFTLATTVASHPSWMRPFSTWSSAADAVQIFPGYNILPEVLPLCGFLAAYIALVGPLNYLVLNRVNRREYAWLSIPAFIILFSVLAWVTGFNLRGNDARVSRIAIVQSWPDSERAHVEQLMGLLSPRRTQYSLTMDDGSFLRPIPQTDTRLLTGNLQVSTEIQQSDVFRAANFSVDASIIASFNASGMIQKPAISGQTRLFYDNAVEILRGSVRNDSGQTLVNPVILTRGVAYRLNDPLEPGDVKSFNLTIPNEGLPAPAPMADVLSAGASRFGFYSYYPNNPNQNIYQSVADVMGDWYNNQAYYQPEGDTPEAQEMRRRQLFLESFMVDYYFTSGRGNKAYLAGWTDQAALPITLDGADWSAQDTTLYVVELDLEFTPPTDDVVVSADQFTWVVRERQGLNEATPLDIALQPGDEVIFRFTPLPDAVLTKVKELVLELGNSSVISRTVPLQLWDWEAGEWVEEDMPIAGPHPVSDPERFLGPFNMVEIRIVADDQAGYVNLQNLTVEQTGVF